MNAQGITVIIGCNVKGERRYTFDHVLNTAVDVLGMVALTAYPATGVYKGEKEQSAVIGVYCDEQEQARIRYAIPALCAQLEQDCILCDSTAFGLEYLTAQDVEKVAAAK